jgi:acylphosphatase
MDGSRQETQSRFPVEGQHDAGTLDPGAHLSAIVSGDVQRVGFRAFVRQQARTLRLSGWVRNLPDGNVALEAEGPREALEALARHLHRGPPGSVVAQVRLVWSPEQGWDHGFAVMR